VVVIALGHSSRLEKAGGLLESFATIARNRRK
jgi:hypothetical protein